MALLIKHTYSPYKFFLRKSLASNESLVFFAEDKIFKRKAFNKNFSCLIKNNRQLIDDTLTKSYAHRKHIYQELEESFLKSQTLWFVDYLINWQESTHLESRGLVDISFACAEKICGVSFSQTLAKSMNKKCEKSLKNWLKVEISLPFMPYSKNKYLFLLHLKKKYNLHIIFSKQKYRLKVTSPCQQLFLSLKKAPHKDIFRNILELNDKIDIDAI